jgi:hypothetical protein
MQSDDFMLTITLPMLFAAIGFIFWIGSDSRRRRLIAKAQADLQMKLLDRIGSGRELVEFSQSEGGQRFLESLGLEGNNKGMGISISMGKILNSIQRGVILSLLGLGLLFVGWKFQFEHHVFSILGVLALSLGLGFLISSAISYRLSKGMGLIPQVESPNARTQTQM